jgi:hypothetical protein
MAYVLNCEVSAQNSSSNMVSKLICTPALPSIVRYCYFIVCRMGREGGLLFATQYCLVYFRLNVSNRRVLLPFSRAVAWAKHEILFWLKEWKCRILVTLLGLMFPTCTIISEKIIFMFTLNGFLKNSFQIHILLRAKSDIHSQLTRAVNSKEHSSSLQTDNQQVTEFLEIL